MLHLKVWCEGPTDRPIIRQLLQELGESEIASTIAFVGGWSNFLSETDPERWLDGCRQAVIIMDGDQGRHLTKSKRPLTTAAKSVVQRFRGYPISLRVLRRYGIEHYLPQRLYEQHLSRDLSAYFPIPDHKKIDEHFCEQRSFFERIWAHLRGRKNPTFYRKHSNQILAEQLTLNDISGTDLHTILQEIHVQADAIRQEP